MGMVHSRLKEYVSFQKTIDTDWERVKVGISPSTDPGEVETKISHRLLAQDGDQDGEIDGNDALSCTVHLNDSDMVMLTLPMVGRDISVINEDTAINVSSLSNELILSLVNNQSSLNNQDSIGHPSPHCKSSELG